MGSVLTKTRRVFGNGYHADVCACVCVCVSACVRVRARARACLSTCVHVSARGEQWMGLFGECLEPIVCRAVSLCFLEGDHVDILLQAFTKFGHCRMQILKVGGHSAGDYV